MTGTAAVAGMAEAASATAISVDFTKTVANVPSSNIGFTATTFGVEGGPVPNSASDIASLKALDAGAVRIHLTPNGSGGIVSGADGGDKSIPGDAWLNAYKQIGVTPTVIVNLDQNDALAVLNYLNATGHDVRRFILGNEMDANSKANVSQADYVTKFHQIAAAMRAVKPGIEIGGPAVACWDCFNQQFVTDLLNAPANERPSFIDYHSYGAGDGQSAAMSTSLNYDAQLTQLRAWINDPSVGIEIGEYNMNWGNDPQNNTQTQTEWVANALGTILSHGAVAFQYGDKNNAMGLTSNNGTPKASYWGLGMFTGASEFRHFGSTMVASTSSDSAVRVYASNGDKNIVIVNSGGATRANVNMTGFVNGSADEWQATNITPVHKGMLTMSGNSLGVDLPGNSVTTLVLTDGGAVVNPTTSTTVIPTTTTTVTTIAPKPVVTTTSTTVATVPVSVPVSVVSVPPTTSTTLPSVSTGSRHGLTASYFANGSLTGTPVLTRTDQTVNFNWGVGSPAAGVPSDNFSARWSGQVQPEHSETYTFRTSSDDGVRLWIDGKLVIDHWSDHSWTDDTASVALIAGHKYDIKMEYYEHANTAVAILRWSSPSTPLQVIPAKDLSTSTANWVANSVHGLTGTYFSSADLTGTPVLTRTDQTVNFNWGVGSPAAGVPSDNFSVRWSGQVQPEHSETYTFRTSSDDGVRLWVDDKLVIDHWTDHSWTDDTASVALIAGHKYDIKMEYYEHANTAVAILRWSSPSTPLQVIPAKDLWATS